MCPRPSRLRLWRCIGSIRLCGRRLCCSAVTSSTRVTKKSCAPFRPRSERSTRVRCFLQASKSDRALFVKRSKNKGAVKSPCQEKSKSSAKIDNPVIFAELFCILSSFLWVRFFTHLFRHVSSAQAGTLPRGDRQPSACRLVFLFSCHFFFLVATAIAATRRR